MTGSNSHMAHVRLSFSISHPNLAAIIYSIPSLKMTAQKLRLSLRFILKNNVNNDLRDIWELSSKSNIHLDSLLEREPTKSAALLALNAEQLTRDVDHISTLKIQGRLLTAVREAFDEATVRKWAEMVSNLLPDTLLVRKKGLP